MSSCECCGTPVSRSFDAVVARTEVSTLSAMSAGATPQPKAIRTSWFKGHTPGADSIFADPVLKERYAPDFSEQVREMAAIELAHQRWQVVRSDLLLPARAGHCGQAPPMSISASEVQVRSGAAAVVVPVDLHNLDFAHDVLAAVQAAVNEATHGSPSPSSNISAESQADSTSGSPEQAVVIGVLVAAKGPPTEEAVLQAQHTMLEAGADDVILKSGTQDELCISLAMAAARVQHYRLKAMRGRQRQQQLFEELKQRVMLEAQTAGFVHENEDPPHGMFWQVVHSAFKGFPSLDRRLPATACVGMQVGEFKFTHVLGTGTFGCVFSAVNTQTQELEAIKTIEKKSLVDVESVKGLWHEMRCLLRLKHENIISFLGAVHGPNYICIRMEYAGSKNLYRTQSLAGGRFSPAVSRVLEHQLVSAIAYCHSQGVAHRDLKPENMGLDSSNTLKLLDFGSASPATKLSADLVGTMPFIAPEIHKSSASQPYCPADSDIWSCGVILLEMLFGIGKMDRMMGWSRECPPCPRRCEEIHAFFRDRNAMQISLATDLGTVDFTLQGLMSGMLQPDSARRFKAVAVLASPWMQPDPAERKFGVPGSPNSPPVE